MFSICDDALRNLHMNVTIFWFYWDIWILRRLYGFHWMYAWQFFVSCLLPYFSDVDSNINSTQHIKSNMALVKKISPKFLPCLIKRSAWKKVIFYRLMQVSSSLPQSSLTLFLHSISLSLSIYIYIYISLKLITPLAFSVHHEDKDFQDFLCLRTTIIRHFVTFHLFFAMNFFSF